MSWLNFNDSLNSLKGQINAFASNVLAEDEGQELSDTDCKELKELCHHQELEIKKLREELERGQTRSKAEFALDSNDAFPASIKPQDDSNGSWNWDDNEESDSKVPIETISTLKKNIATLETEKAELQVQLEQLDADNQENLQNIMRIKDKLHVELNELNENYVKVKEENAILIKEVQSLKQLQEGDGIKNKSKDAEIFDNLSDTNKKLNNELEKLKKELHVIKSSNETFQKIIENSKRTDANDFEGKIKILEEEKKLLYSELKKANEQILFFEKKSIEDEDNCQKLAVILESYETQVSSLKKEVDDYTSKYEESQKHQKELEKLYNNLKFEYESLEKKHQNDVKSMQDEIINLKSLLDQKNQNDQEEEIARWKKEIDDLKKLNEDLQVKASGRMDIYLEEELNDIREEHETQLNVLREELEQLKNQDDCNNKYEDINKQYKEIENLYNELKNEHESLQKQYQIQLEDEKKDQTAEIERWKKEIIDLKTLNEELLVKASGRMDMDLEDELETIQQEHEVQLNVLREELEQLKCQENKNMTDNDKFEELEEKKLDVTRELNDLQQQYAFLQENHKVSLYELHNKYINIITDNIKKFQECEKPSDFEHCVHEDDPQAAELCKHIENIIKILLELKCKSADLEKRILEITEEKNAILVDKNHEIEKLIQNSDLLTQEIVAKNQTIKEYQTECNEIAQNNDLLINELETCKSNPGLQTISESNEDSMILLESQLENANKRIEDLEKIINYLEKQKPHVDTLDGENLENAVIENATQKLNRTKMKMKATQKDEESFDQFDDLENQQVDTMDGEHLEKSDLENAIAKLIETKTEIKHKNKDYDTLLNSFDQLQIHCDSLKKELYETAENLSFSNEKNLNLKTTLEKLKSEYEMFEYQISELNMNSESLKEEVEEFKAKFNALLSENSKLKLQNEEFMKSSTNHIYQIDMLKQHLTIGEDNKKALESQIETLTEKLKTCKMAETTLKLQYEQKSKELAIQSEARYNLEVTLNKMNTDLAEFQNNFVELQAQNDQLQIQQEKLQQALIEKDKMVKELENTKQIQEKLDNTELIDSSTTTENKENNEKVVNEDYNNLKQILDETVLEKANLHAQLSKLPEIQSQLKEATERCSTLHQQLQEVTNSRNELINMVTMKHQENVTYHNEIQRLNQVLTSEVDKYRNLEKQFNEIKSKASAEDIQEKNKELDKLTDQNNFLREKCEVIAKNLLEEQSKVQQLLAERSVPSENEKNLQKKLDRLQAHLIESEEHYTEDLYQAEQKNQALKTKLLELEKKEKSSSTMYTSVSIRANQQVESLQSQLQSVIQERDSLRKQISDAEDENTKQAAALANLQFVLEQFRKDKEKDVMKETERIRRHINTEKQIQEELRAEMSNLKSQLEERNQGLLAAARLSDQLESSKKIVSGLKEEVTHLQSKLSKTEDELKNALSNTDGKVDKLLIKNLILGFVMTNNNLNRDQTQILRIIATVLDFNQQDHDKVKLNKPQQGWLSSFLAPEPDSQKLSEESLSRAFIKFLENESKPRVVPSLLNNATPADSTSTTKSTNSRSTTPGQTPIVLSEIVLPTFTDFAQNRNSSSILKDVLKDNS